MTVNMPLKQTDTIVLFILVFLFGQLFIYNLSKNLLLVWVTYEMQSNIEIKNFIVKES